jgi:hypothetical protein
MPFRTTALAASGTATRAFASARLSLWRRRIYNQYRLESRLFRAGCAVKKKVRRYIMRFHPNFEPDPLGTVRHSNLVLGNGPWVRIHRIKENDEVWISVTSGETYNDTDMMLTGIPTNGFVPRTSAASHSEVTVSGRRKNGISPESPDARVQPG